MAASTARKEALSALKRGVDAWQGKLEVLSIAQRFTQRHERMIQENEEAKKAVDSSNALQQRSEVPKSFAFHLGADINIPTSTPRIQAMSDAPVEANSTTDPFAGLPLQAWAERLGERVMPAYDLIKEERKRAKAAGRPAAAVAAPPIYSVPHLLPITRWAANNKSFKETFIAEDGKARKKARMSWYHPDDTMVPRDWFKGGLLADLKYYSPFRSSASQ